MNGRREKLLTTVVMALALAGTSVGTAGCANKVPWVARPAEGDGVRVELSSERYGSDNANLLLRVINKTNDTLVIDLNAVVLVLPDGRAVQQVGGKHWFTLWGNLSRYLRLKYDSKGFDFYDAPGVWLRVDGAFIGEHRVRLPPLRIAEPAHPPGQPLPLAVPDLAREEFAKGRERMGGSLPVASGSTGQASAGWSEAPTAAGRGRSPTGGSEPAPSAWREERTAPAATTSAMAPAPAPAARPRPAADTVATPRQSISGPDTKLAALPLKAANVADSITFIMDDLLLTELQAVGFEAIGREDMYALVGLDVMQEHVTCDDEVCAVEIGAALGVTYLLSGNVADIEGMTVLTLKLVNVRRGKVVARVSKMADGGPRVLPQVIAEAVLEMVQRAGL